MIREMEKVFENLKEEFNRKISSDSLFSYFVNNNDVSRDVSSSDSFEDISLERSHSAFIDPKRHDEESFLIGSIELSELRVNLKEDTCNLRNECDTITDSPKIDYDSFHGPEVINELIDQECKAATSATVEDTKVETVTDVKELGTAQDTDDDVFINIRYSYTKIMNITNESVGNSQLKVITEEEISEPNKPITDEHTSAHVQRINNVLCIQQRRLAAEEEAREDNRRCDNSERSPSTLTEDVHSEQMESDSGGSTLMGAPIVSLPNQEDQPIMFSQSKSMEEKDCVSRQRVTITNNVKKQSFHRMMWSEMPEVIESGILAHLSKKQIQLQEAMFEIIASEASYYQSLMILTSHFFESDLFKLTDGKDRPVSSLDKHHIFSNVILIMYTSQNFLNDLDRRWRDEKPRLTQICDIILRHASGDDFQNYVTYLRNQEYQSKALKRLAENETFKHILDKLETSSVCGKLSMVSYLMLPMQRLTRLKLLIEALLKLMYSSELRVPEEHINTAVNTLDKVKQLLDISDIEKGFMDQKSMLMLLMNKMDFPSNFKGITISDKVFIKEDDFRVYHQNPLKHIRKFSKKRQPIISLILFNDLLIVAKKKGPRMLVLDYCDRTNIEVTETKYKSIMSSADVSSIDTHDHAPDVRKSSAITLARSKTSMSPDDWRRFNTTLSSSLRSMSLTSRGDEHEIINNSFSLRFVESKTDIFSVPIVLLSKDREQRDEWMTLLSKTSINEGRLHKTSSLRNNTKRKDDFRFNKSSYFCGNKKDDHME